MKEVLRKKLPHRDPFVFVDEVLEATEHVFVTRQPGRYVAGFFPDSGVLPATYPRALLIEHVAQTMFLHGYNIGLIRNYWGEDYQPAGLLVGLNDVHFSNTPLDWDDHYICRSLFIKNSRGSRGEWQLVEIYAEIHSEKTGHHLFEGTVKGMFLPSGDVAQRSMGDGEDCDFVDHGLVAPMQFCRRDDDQAWFASNHWFLPGHFPGAPCIPGCFLLEGYLQSRRLSLADVTIDKISFRKMAVPTRKYEYVTVSEEGLTTDFEVRDQQTGFVCARGSFTLRQRMPLTGGSRIAANG